MIDLYTKAQFHRIVEEYAEKVVITQAKKNFFLRKKQRILVSHYAKKLAKYVSKLNRWKKKEANAHLTKRSSMIDLLTKKQYYHKLVQIYAEKVALTGAKRNYFLRQRETVLANHYAKKLAKYQKSLGTWKKYEAHSHLTRRSSMIDLLTQKQRCDNNIRHSKEKLEIEKAKKNFFMGEKETLLAKHYGAKQVEYQKA